MDLDGVGRRRRSHTRWRRQRSHRPRPFDRTPHHAAPALATDLGRPNTTKPSLCERQSRRAATVHVVGFEQRRFVHISRSLLRVAKRVVQPCRCDLSVLGRALAHTRSPPRAANTREAMKCHQATERHARQADSKVGLCAGQPTKPARGCRRRLLPWLSFRRVMVCSIVLDLDVCRCGCGRRTV